MNCKLFPSVCLGGEAGAPVLTATDESLFCPGNPSFSGKARRACCAHLRQMMGKSRVMPTAVDGGELTSAAQAALLHVRTAAQRKTWELEPQWRDPTPGPPAQSSKRQPQSISCQGSQINFLALFWNWPEIIPWRNQSSSHIPSMALASELTRG